MQPASLQLRARLGLAVKGVAIRCEPLPDVQGSMPQACALHYVARPSAAGMGRTLIAHAPDSSFPSDHATLMAAVAVSLLLVRETRIAGAMLALLWLPMSWARVYVGVHFPGDLMGGALVGTAAALLVWACAGSLVPPVTAGIQRLYSSAFGALIERGWVR